VLIIEFTGVYAAALAGTAFGWLGFIPVFLVASVGVYFAAAAVEDQR